MSPDTPTPAERPTRRRLRPVALLAISLVVLDLAVRHFAPTWERHSPDDYAARIDGCHARPRDFIVVGGSPVSEGFDPDAMAGLTWQGRPLSDGYAVGLPGATTTDVYFALRHAAPVAPKLVIYGLSPTDLNDARNEPHGAYSIDSAADVADIWRTRPDVRSWTVRRYAEGQARSLWGVYRYRHGLRMAAALACNERFPDSCPGAAAEAANLRTYADALSGGRGYAPAAWFADTRYDQRKAAGAAFAPFDFLDQYRLGSHARYLDRLAEWCDASGAKLVVVVMPLTADLEAKYPAALAAFGQFRERWRPAGVTVLLADRATLGLTDADFADIIHLNRAGARKLSAWTRDAVNALPAPAVGRGAADGAAP